MLFKNQKAKNDSSLYIPFVSFSQDTLKSLNFSSKAVQMQSMVKGMA